jgi:peptidoglycan/xylan/chitin deacetylase (PgdA/CDA1 family)
MNMQHFSRQLVCILVMLCASLMLLSCASQPPAAIATTNHIKNPYPIRFLLTFDDGPSILPDFNPTKSILEDLANNPIQPGIKALFFVQTRARNGGGTDEGREIIKQEWKDGHLLGFHTATPRHVNHPSLTPDMFEQSLKDGIQDCMSITGEAPKIVRPPFWNYDHRTFTTYEAYGMRMLLTHLSAKDGKIYGITFSLRRRSNLYNELAKVSEKIQAGSMPVVNGLIPVIVTLLDIN